MSDLMQKLAVSKKIMDKHNGTPRNQGGGSLPMTENINATYNVPQDMLQQQVPQQQVPQQQVPQSTNNGGPVTENAIKNSKLPDDIKKLMLENPIVQPQSNSPTLTDDIIQDSFVFGASQRGLKLQDSRFYIQKIRIKRTSSSEDNNVITLFNPLITAVQGDTLSYSDSNPVQYRIEFAYEGYDIKTL